jgi:hypothetical protein
VNGYGFSDVIVGAPSFDDPDVDEGRAYLYLGSAAGLSTIPAWSVESDLAGAMYGILVATAGDVNGDGFADVIVGADGGPNAQGHAYCIRARPRTRRAPPDGGSRPDGALFGLGASAGDVNGDGYADILVGVPNRRRERCGPRHRLSLLRQQRRRVFRIASPAAHRRGRSRAWGLGHPGLRIALHLPPFGRAVSRSSPRSSRSARC